MENAGLRWDKQEDQQLIKLFTKYKMNIPDIASIHMRSTESIRLRLIKLNLILEPDQENNKFNEMYLEFQLFKNKILLLESEIISLKNKLSLNSID